MTTELSPQDFLYRVVAPDQWDQHGLLAVAFEDPGKSYESLSFFVSRLARPSDALSVLARFAAAKQWCDVREAPTPTQMYDAGYRVARISASMILAAISATATNPRRLSIERSAEGDFDLRGHLNLHNGKYYAQTLRKMAEMLSRDETLM